MKIALLGFMGCGKTSYGKKLAKQLSLSFIDLDQQIENGENKSISMIFEIYGERYFRILESVYLEKILTEEDNFVLATGGGCPIIKGNMQLLQEHTQKVFLDTPYKMILNRLENAKSKRPLYESLSAEALEELYNSRLSVYNEAKVKINPAETTVEQLANQLK